MIKEKDNGFYIGDINNPDAMITFLEDDNITIERTYVDKKLRGQGVALKLLDEVIKYARKRNKKIIPLCSYAKDQLKNPKYEDIILK